MDTMKINWLQRKMRWFSSLLLVNLLVCGSSIAAQQPVSNNTDVKSMVFQVNNVPVEPQSAEEALSYANRLKSIADAIKSKYQNIFAAGSSQTGISTIIITKIKAIIAAIEVQRQNLVDMITAGSTTNTTNPEKLNEIINSLESQRTALSDLIAPEENQTANTSSVIPGTNASDGSKSFEIYNPK